MGSRITKHEILTSVIIFLVSVGLGLIICNFIADKTLESNEKYLKIPVAESIEMFNYCKDTSVTEIFSVSDIESNKTVELPELEGQYLAIKREEECYNLHTRTYTIVDSKGHSSTHVETYHSWDLMDIDYFNDDKIIVNENCIDFRIVENLPYMRLNIDDNYNKNFKAHKVNSNYIYVNSNKRYSYWMVPFEISGSCLAKFNDKNIEIVYFSPIESPYEFRENQLMNPTIFIVIFAIVWLVGTGFIIYKFVMLENDWLD